MADVPDHVLDAAEQVRQQLYHLGRYSGPRTADDHATLAADILKGIVIVTGYLLEEVMSDG